MVWVQALLTLSRSSLECLGLILLRIVGFLPLDSLLSMSMRKGETLKTYSNRYWEIFNEIDGDFDDMAIRTFKVGLPTEHDLRKSLTKKPIRSVHRLMDCIDEYKWVKEDQQQGRGRVRLSLGRWGISGRLDTTIIDPEGILLDNLDSRLLRWLTLYSEN